MKGIAVKNQLLYCPVIACDGDKFERKYFQQIIAQSILQKEKTQLSQIINSRTENQFPQLQIGRIVVSFHKTNQTLQFGTGILLRSDIILTAARNLYFEPFQLDYCYRHGFVTSKILQQKKSIFIEKQQNINLIKSNYALQLIKLNKIAIDHINAGKYNQAIILFKQIQKISAKLYDLNSIQRSKILCYFENLYYLMKTNKFLNLKHYESSQRIFQQKLFFETFKKENKQSNQNISYPISHLNSNTQAKNRHKSLNVQITEFPLDLNQTKNVKDNKQKTLKDCKYSIFQKNISNQIYYIVDIPGFDDSLGITYQLQHNSQNLISLLIQTNHNLMIEIKQLKESIELKNTQIKQLSKNIELQLFQIKSLEKKYKKFINILLNCQQNLSLKKQKHEINQFINYLGKKTLSETRKDQKKQSLWLMSKQQKKQLQNSLKSMQDLRQEINVDKKSALSIVSDNQLKSDCQCKNQNSYDKDIDSDNSNEFHKIMINLNESQISERSLLKIKTANLYKSDQSNQINQMSTELFQQYQEALQKTKQDIYQVEEQKSQLNQCKNIALWDHFELFYEKSQESEDQESNDKNEKMQEIKIDVVKIIKRIKTLNKKLQLLNKKKENLQKLLLNQW